MNNITLGADQTWKAAAGPLVFGGTTSDGGFTLTIDGSRNVTFIAGSGLTGSGGLTKSGTNTLTINAPLTFTGAITLNNGKIETSLNNVLSSGQNITFNGGTLSGLSKSQTLGALTLAASSRINLQPGNGVGVLTFSSASVSGGTLTIAGWTGTAGQPASDDKIVINAAPNAAFLSAVQFLGAGFGPGAVYLAATHEIVPAQPLSPPTPTTLSSPMRLSDTEFQFIVSDAVAGRSYTFQRSTNLTNWIPLAPPYTATTNQFIFQDPYATNSLGFYRLLSNP